MLGSHLTLIAIYDRYD